MEAHRRLHLVVLALVGCAAVARVGAVVPGDITTCTNANGTSMPHINSVKTCSSVAIISKSAKGFSFAWSRTETKALVSAAGICGDAVASGLGAICKGKDRGVSIVTAANVCANALAALYARTASGALTLPEDSKNKVPSIIALLNPKVLAELQPTKEGFYTACAGSCTNAQSTAEALAQGAACGAVRATDSCIAVQSEVRGDVFARAFASVVTEGWSKACAQGSAAALTGTTVMAASAATAFADAISRVADRACASCPSCKCSPLPSIGGLNLAGRWSGGFPSFAGGKYALVRELAAASSAQCASGVKNSSSVETDAAMAAVADMVAGALGSARAHSIQVGSATACSGATVSAQLQAMKQASAKVISDAGATVFGSWCPAAEAQLKNVGLMTEDFVSRAANKTVQACTGEKKGPLSFLLPGALKVSQQEKVIVSMVMANKPLRKKFNEALTQAKRCGCPPSLCLFCHAATYSPAMLGAKLGAKLGSVKAASASG